MISIENIPIVEVTKKNIKKFWSHIIKDVSQSSFIAIDAEMSGLGLTKNTMTSNINDRYAAISSYAASRSIISLGLACFTASTSVKESEVLINANKHIDLQKDLDVIEFKVSVYNILLLCSDPYTIDPSAVEFLVSHGFNFNKQFSEGISFYKGNDKINENLPEFNMRRLFSEIICRRKPLVLHNGLADLVFMYQNFYADCPSKITALMADYSEIFPSGIYDTKYLAEFFDHAPASFLLYFYKYSLLKNVEQNDKRKVSMHVKFDKKIDDVIFVSLSEPEESSSPLKICEKYAAYGWCIQGFHCKKSHNIDAIIKMHRTKSSRKRKRKKSFNSNSDSNYYHSTSYNYNSDEEDNDKTKSLCISTEQPSDITICKDNDEGNKTFDNIIDSKSIQLEEPDPKIFSESKSCDSKLENVSLSHGHRSGVDAFMTGYAFAMFVVSRCKFNEAFSDCSSESELYSDSIPFMSSDLKKSIVNKLYLSGKSIPLQVCKSTFTKTSKNHNKKIVKVYLN